MSDIDRTRMIPLHIADQAVAACDAEIAKLRDENARLKAKEEAVKYFTSELEVAMTTAEQNEHEKATATVHGARRIFNRIIGGGF